MGKKKYFKNAKRPASNDDESGASSKKRRFIADGLQPLTVGTKGILFTTAGHGGFDRRFVEAVSVVKEYLVGVDKQVEEKAFDQTDAANVGDSLDAGVRELQTESSCRKSTDPQKIYCLETRVKNTVFVATPADCEPVELVKSIMDDVKNGKKRPNRLLQQILPCQMTCSAHVEQIGKAVKELLQPYLTSEGATASTEWLPTYAVLYKNRNNSHMKRQQVYDAVVDVFSAAWPQSKVSLSAPKLAILVNVVQQVCCLSIVPNCASFKAFNWNNF